MRNLLPVLLLSGCYAGHVGGFVTKPAAFLRSDYEPSQTYVCASRLSVANLDATDRNDRYQFQCVPYQEFIQEAFLASKGRAHLAHGER